MEQAVNEDLLIALCEGELEITIDISFLDMLLSYLHCQRYWNYIELYLPEFDKKSTVKMMNRQTFFSYQNHTFLDFLFL